MALQNVGDVIDGYAGRLRAVLDYSVAIKRLVDEAKKPGFSEDALAPLAALVDIERFGRVGPFKDVMDWPGYVAFLTNWAASSDWDCSFKSITESPDAVFLELEERNKIGDFSNVVNSLSVYKFNDDGKITHIDLYLQMEMPPADMLQGLEVTQVSND